MVHKFQCSLLGIKQLGDYSSSETIMLELYMAHYVWHEVLMTALGRLGPRPKPTPVQIASSIPMCDTGSDLRWGWLGSGTETMPLVAILQ